MIAALLSLGWLAAFVLMLTGLYLLHEALLFRRLALHYQALYRQSHQQSIRNYEDLLIAKGAKLALEEGVQGKADRVVERLFGDRAH